MNLVKAVLLILLLTLIASVTMVAQAPFDTEAEQLVLDQLNQSRRQAGLGSLKVSPELVQAARQHSLGMAQRRELAHQLSGEPDLQQRLASTGVHFFRSGENVGFNSQEDQIHAAFMHSPPHRQNLLTPDYNSVGIGIVRRGENFWVTEDFAQLEASLSTDEATSRAAQAFAQLRSRERQFPLTLVEMPQLREAACTMARSGDMNTRQLLQMPGVRYTIAYTNAQPDVLPPDVSRIAAQPLLKRFAVGSCFVQNERTPGGIFWVAMVFF